MNNPVLSVVIPVRNGARTLADQLRSLADQEFDRDWEVVIADNGSTDGTVELAMSFNERLPGLQIVDASARRGQAFALNAGVAATRGTMLVFLDADDEITPGYLESMAAAMADAPFVGAAMDVTSLAPTWMLTSEMVRTTGTDVAFSFLPAAAGCSLGIWRSAFDAAGGFDPNVFAGNDVDLCWRVQLKSYQLRFVPDAVVRYRARQTLAGVFSQARGRGASGPALFRRYRDLGMPRRSLRSVPRFYGGALLRLARARSKSDLAACAYLFGFRLGLIEGCIRHRVLYF